MAIDMSQLRTPPHTRFYQSFFLLRIPQLTINDQPVQTTVSNDGHLTIGCPSVSITFDSLTTEVDTIVKKYGLEGVSNYWCEDVPLFELRLPSHGNLKSFLRSEEKVQKELASRVAGKLAQEQRSSEPVAVYAHTEVYMLTPRPESKDARVIQVSSENLDFCTTLWRESEVFGFEALFNAFHKGILNQGNCMDFLHYKYLGCISMVLSCCGTFCMRAIVETEQTQYSRYSVNTSLLYRTSGKYLRTYTVMQYLNCRLA